MTEKQTRAKPLGLDMDPDEAFRRLLQTDPADIPHSANLHKKKPPPKRRGQEIDGKPRPKPRLAEPD